jgi:hypothetical protein
MLNLLTIFAFGMVIWQTPVPDRSPSNPKPENSVVVRSLPDVSGRRDVIDYTALGFTCLLTIIGYLGVRAANRTLKTIELQVAEMKAQTSATQKAADAALTSAQAVINAERAWIMAELGDWGKPLQIVEGVGSFHGQAAVETTEIRSVKLTCKNRGKSPAWIDMVYAQVNIVDSTTDWVDPPKTVGNHGPMEPLGPGEEGFRSLELRCPGRRNGGEFLSIFVVIEYRDIFDVKRKTVLGYSVHQDGNIGRQSAIPNRNRNT